jgi:hypothetical protein
MRSVITRHSRLLALAATLICGSAVISSAQSSKQDATLRIGVIKDYPATGLMTGCGNLYFHRRGQAATDTNYVFLSRGDGSDAWMNLNGRDVRLQQIKKGASANPKLHRLSYRHGGWQITVFIEDFKPKTAASESDGMSQMKITVRKGRDVRVVQAVGDSDC